MKKNSVFAVTLLKLIIFQTSYDEFFLFWLTFFRQLVFRAAASLIPYFLKGFIIKYHSDLTTISTILLLVLVMIPNGANIILKHG